LPAVADEFGHWVRCQPLLERFVSGANVLGSQMLGMVDIRGPETAVGSIAQNECGIERLQSEHGERCRCGGGAVVVRAHEVGDICGGTEAVKAVALVGNNHAHETAGLQEAFAIAEEADGVGEVLEIMATHDPVELVHHALAADDLEKVGGVSHDIDLLDARDLSLGDIAPPRLFPKAFRVENINDERLEAIPLRGYGISLRAEFDASGVREHRFAQSFKAGHVVIGSILSLPVQFPSLVLTK